VISIDEQGAWQAILERDARRDGEFVYGVRTTGIACRPSCPSRRPLRANVELFATRAEALRAGYRPCERCRAEPAGADGTLERARTYLEGHLDERVTLVALSRAIGLSPYHLQRAFSRAFGVSPRRYQERRRLERFKRLVRAGEPVGEATYGAGFGSSRALYESARSGLGMTPGKYRSGGRGESIRFTVLASEPDRLLVAVTERGICAVEVGDDEAALTEALAREFPNAVLKRDDGALRCQADQVLAVIGGSRRAALPLDLRGTAFQLRVWRALQEIPRGETRSYAAIAARIGSPGASRAVARACASNRIALIVPCHRVVRANGDPGGYRWGAERKRRVLAAERKAEGRASRKATLAEFP
jgi:AraC family transcriptional regulator of adaptative response/methylated-DNA-[protein]-cysteine methyltransferase